VRKPLLQKPAQVVAEAVVEVEELFTSRRFHDLIENGWLTVAADMPALVARFDQRESVNE